MKRIYVNLKRFDVPAELGGVNRLAEAGGWAEAVMRGVLPGLARYRADEAEFTFFFPEAHILPAAALAGGANAVIGCQGVYREDIAPGGNFGAFTTNLPAAAAKALGCGAAIIGHCEERRALAGVIGEAGGGASAVNRILNAQVRCALNRGPKVLYCVGETAEERGCWQEVLGAQLESGLKDAAGDVTIGYEPVWAIGPGKTPPGRDAIQETAQFIKRAAALPVVYGGGLKADNAAMLASILEIDGGLIALTRFSGEIGFYPDEYLEIVRQYLGN